MIRRQSRGRLSTSLSMPTQARRSRSSSISTPPTTRCTATRKGASSTAITTATAICRSTSSAAGICWRPSCAVPTSTRRPGRLRKWRGSSGRSHPLAARAHPAARRFGVCPRCANDMVRTERGRLPVRPGPHQPAGRRDRRRASRSPAAEPGNRQAGAPLQGVVGSTLDSWSRERRVVAKAEWLPGSSLGGEANPRFVVTSLDREEAEARYLYETIYCARGEMENRIKECQLDLFADRTSARTMRANQLRLWFAAMAYVLLCALRRIALRHTQFAEATCGTIRLKLLKIGALVRVSVAASRSRWPRPAPTGTSAPPICASLPLRADHPRTAKSK